MKCTFTIYRFDPAVDEAPNYKEYAIEAEPTDKILDCLLSTVHNVQVSGLSLEAADIQPPIMEGFVARGIDRVVSDQYRALQILP